MSLSKRYFFTAKDEAGMLLHYLGSPLETVSRWWNERRKEKFQAEQEFGKLSPDHEHRLEVEIRLMSVALRAGEPILAGLDLIHSTRLNFSPTDCIQRAYDLCASELQKCGQSLTDPLLKRGLPDLVFTIAVEKDWIAYPLRTAETGHNWDTLERWSDNSAPEIPKTKLTERFAHYRVPDGYGAWFKSLVENRVDYWREKVGEPAEAPECSQKADRSGKPKPPVKVNTPVVTTPNRRNRGPQRDVETGKQVETIVKGVNGGVNWTAKANLEVICQKLDEAKVPTPKTWKRRSPRIEDWTDAAATDAHLAKKAIKNHLKNARL
jgi:hypothetical protein